VTVHSESIAFPVLVADIGGTNARFAVLADSQAALTVFPTVQAADFVDPVAAIRSLDLPAKGLAPKTAIMAVAGPVTSDRVQMTNSHWVIEPKRMLAELGMEKVILINDFEAQALALPAYTADDLESLGGGAPRAAAPMVVLGPGTGLGVAGMIHAGGRWTPVPGEGGHVAMGPETDEEFLIWPHIEGVGEHIEAEHLVSGRGVLNVARAVAAADGVACPYDTPATVTAAASAGEPLADRALTIFAGLLGRLAGDMALTFLARGGVFITGGVSLHVAGHLAGGAFRRAFENKAPHHGLVAAMPTWLVRHPQPAMLGLSAFARAPETYAVDLSGRRWTV
jgi:glucokinase